MQPARPCLRRKAMIAARLGGNAHCAAEGQLPALFAGNYGVYARCGLLTAVSAGIYGEIRIYPLISHF